MRQPRQWWQPQHPFGRVSNTRWLPKAVYFTKGGYDDEWRGLQAALLLVELKKAGVSAELHIYSRGGHGYGLRPSENPVSHRPKLCGQWIQTTGL